MPRPLGSRVFGSGLLPLPRVGVLLGAAAILMGPSLAPTPARAHAIQSDLQLLGAADLPPAGAKASASASRLQITSSFSTGQPASDATVRLLGAAGRPPVELGRTDGNGRLAFVLPAHTAADAEIQVDAGAGHRDWIELSELGPHRISRGRQPLDKILLSIAPIAALGLLGGLAHLRRPRG